MPAMPNPTVWYVSSTGWSAVQTWVASTAHSVGEFLRDNYGPGIGVGSERVYVCTVAGTSGGSLPSWTPAKGGLVVDGTARWIECTGQPAVNGDSVNTPTWDAAAKSNTVAVGQIVKRASGGSYQICTTAGTAGSGAEPSFSNTAGVTTADGSVTWTSLGSPSNYAPWGAPHRMLSSAEATGWGAVGNTFYLSDTHAESYASALTVFSFIATSANPTEYFCADDTAAPPTSLSIGASFTTTGNNGLKIGTSGGNCIIVHGINFNCGTGTDRPLFQIIPTVGYFENCAFNYPVTGAVANGVNFGNSTSHRLDLVSCTFSVGSTSHFFQFDTKGFMNIVGGSTAQTGAVPATRAFTMGASQYFNMRDHDLSALPVLFDVSHPVASSEIRVQNCKLAAGVAFSTGDFTNQADLHLRFHNCASDATNYRFYEQSYMGTMRENTTVTRVGGASDGTTAESFHIATTANTSFYFPFQFLSLEIVQWNDTVGAAKTATIEFASGSTLTNADIWFELEYYGDASFPLGSNVSCRAADIVATPANHPASSSTWNGSPAVAQKMSVTFTPQMKGPIKARLYVAKPSTTVYVDPLIVVA